MGGLGGFVVIIQHNGGAEDEIEFGMGKNGGVEKVHSTVNLTVSGCSSHEIVIFHGVGEGRLGTNDHSGVVGDEGACHLQDTSRMFLIRHGIFLFPWICILLNHNSFYGSAVLFGGHRIGVETDERKGCRHHQPAQQHAPHNDAAFASLSHQLQ